MKPSFHARLFNGPFDDPGLYIRVLREGRALMFDLGSTTSLSSGDILKTTDIFISHTHVDHFIGFDSVLRVSLRKEGPLRFYGPEGFIDCVEGKLRSYTWNLIGDYPLVIEVSEIHDEIIKKAHYRAKNSFKREALKEEPFNGIVMKNSLFLVSAVILDHQIPCLAYSLKEDYHINIDKSKLSSMDLPVGPWLGQLKKAIRENKRESLFTINDRTYSYEELRGIANISRGQKLSYVVDAVGSEENINKIIHLIKDSSVVYIETYFLDEDKERAKVRYHLTAKEAGRIAREAGVGQLQAIHFSPKYRNEPERLRQEAESEFRR